MLATMLANASVIPNMRKPYLGFVSHFVWGRCMFMHYKRGYCPFRPILTPANCALAVSPTLLNKNILPAVLFYKEP